MIRQINGEINFTPEKAAAIGQRIDNVRALQHIIMRVGAVEPGVIERSAVSAIKELGAEGLYRAVSAHFDLNGYFNFTTDGKPVHRSKILYGTGEYETAGGGIYKLNGDIASDGTYTAEASADLSKVVVEKSRPGLLRDRSYTQPLLLRDVNGRTAWGDAISGPLETDRLEIRVDEKSDVIPSYIHTFRGRWGSFERGPNAFKNSLEQIGALSLAEAACKLALGPYTYGFVSMEGRNGPARMTDGSLQVVQNGMWRLMPQQQVPA